MKIRNITLGLASLGLASIAQAATLQFSVGFAPGSGLSTNLANASGVVANGLDYGILVDTTGDGFLASYDAIIGTALTSATVATDDLFFYGGTLSDTSQGGVFVEGDFVTPGGDGGAAGFSFTYSDGAAAGQAYALVWFDASFNTDGVSAGTLTDGLFVLPPSADTVDHSAVFIGVDPIRSATGTTFGALIPEPSTTALIGLGGLALILRRRK